MSPSKPVFSLLRVVEQRGLERVVSKRRDAAYRLGECRDWQGQDGGLAPNRERWRLFGKA